MLGRHKRNRKFGGSVSGVISGTFVVAILAVLAVSCHGQTDGSTKDITIVRPKHLKYASYRAQQQNETSNEELENRRHAKKGNPNPNSKRSRSSEILDSEESRHHQIDDRGDRDSTKIGRNNKFTNSSTTEASTSSSTTTGTNLKRSLLPGHGGGDAFGGGGDAKGARFGSPLGIQKTPPDLQFGLAFTVPFVSLSTDKLINTFSGKSYGNNDVSNILKLNLGGLIAAVIVGIGAFFLVPGLLHPGKFGGGGIPGLGGLGGGGGWGGSLLDSILPNGINGILDQFLGGGGGFHGGGGGGGHYGHDGHGDGWAGAEDHVGNRPFGYQDFYEYNGVHNHNRKDTSATLRDKSSRREGRSNVNGTATIHPPPASELFGHLLSTASGFARKYVTTAQSCLQLQICRKAIATKTAAKEKQSKSKKEERKDEGEDEIDLLGLVESLSDNELVRDSPLSQEIKKAHDYGETHGECKQYEKPECK